MVKIAELEIYAVGYSVRMVTSVKQGGCPVAYIEKSREREFASDERIEVKNHQSN